MDGTERFAFVRCGEVIVWNMPHKFRRARAQMFRASRPRRSSPSLSTVAHDAV